MQTGICNQPFNSCTKLRNKTGRNHGAEQFADRNRASFNALFDDGGGFCSGKDEEAFFHRIKPDVVSAVVHRLPLRDDRMLPGGMYAGAGTAAMPGRNNCCRMLLIPLAYMDRIFSSMSWLMLVWFFFSTWGSNSPFRSRGTDTSTSPKLVRSVLLL